MSESRKSASTGCFWISSRNAAIDGVMTASVSTSQSAEISPRSMARRRKSRLHGHPGFDDRRVDGVGELGSSCEIIDRARP